MRPKGNHIHWQTIHVGRDFGTQLEVLDGLAENTEVFVGGIDQVPPGAKFDCVVATQVIEHVYEPLSFVKRLATRTKPGGHIVLATPDIGVY